MNIKGLLKKYFIPHDTNNYQPHFWSSMSVKLSSLLIIACFIGVSYGSLLIRKEGLTAQVIPSLLIDLTNQERARNNLGSLSVNNDLTKAAQLKAEDILANQYFAHTSPTGLTPWYWFDKIGYNFLSAGENLAIHFTDSNELENAWLNSPGHRANIVSGKYTEIGIAAVDGVFQGYPTTVVVELFGKPATRVATQSPEVFSSPVKTNSEIVASAPQKELVKGVSASTTQTNKNSNIKNTTIVKTNPVVTQKEETNNLVVVSENPQTIEVLNTDKTLVEKSVTSEKIHTEKSLKQQLIVNPSNVLKTIYGLFAFFVLAALSVLIFVEYKRQHIPSIISGAFLLLLMFTLYKASVFIF